MSAGAAIVSDKQLGDVLLLQPSAEHLARVTGQPTALFVREAFKPLVEKMPGCVWGPDVQGKFEQVWTTSWSSKAVWQAFLRRTPRRILIVNKPRHIRWWYRLLFKKIIMDTPGAMYWSLYFWRIVSGLPEAQFTPPKLNPPEPSWRHPQEPEKGYLLINPTAAWVRKFWGAAKWAEVIDALSARYGLPIVIAGGGSEVETAHCQEIVSKCHTPVLNLAGQTSMLQYLHLLSSARLVLCVDGAASHLAQALGVATVTVFGPTHEGKWNWPTPRNRVLAARYFANLAPGVSWQTLSANEVPTSAFLNEAFSLMD